MTKIFMQMKRYSILLIFPFLMLSALSIYLLRDEKNSSKKINKTLSIYNKIFYKKQKELNEKVIALDKAQYLMFKTELALINYIKKRKFKKLGQISEEIQKSVLESNFKKTNKILNQGIEIVQTSDLDSQTKQELLQLIENFSVNIKFFKSLKLKPFRVRPIDFSKTNSVSVNKYKDIITYLVIILSIISLILLLLFLLSVWRRFILEKRILQTALTGIREGGSPNILAKLQKMQFLEDLNLYIYNAFQVQKQTLGFTKDLLKGTDNFKILFDTDKETKEILSSLKIKTIKKLGSIFYFEDFYYFVDNLSDRAFLFKLNAGTLYKISEEIIKSAKRVSPTSTHLDIEFANMFLKIEDAKNKESKNTKLLNIYKKNRKKLRQKIKDLQLKTLSLNKALESFNNDAENATTLVDTMKDDLQNTVSQFSKLLAIVSRIQASVESVSVNTGLIEEQEYNAQNLINTVEKIKSQFELLKQETENKSDILRNIDLSLENLEVTADGVKGNDQVILDLLSKFDRLEEIEDLTKKILKSYENILG